MGEKNGGDACYMLGEMCARIEWFFGEVRSLIEEQVVQKSTACTKLEIALHLAEWSQRLRHSYRVTEVTV